MSIQYYLVFIKKIIEDSVILLTVVIRYNTIGGVHKYESCYKPIVLYEMARFYLVLIGRYDWRYMGCGRINNWHGTLY